MRNGMTPIKQAKWNPLLVHSHPERSFRQGVARAGCGLVDSKNKPVWDFGHG